MLKLQVAKLKVFQGRVALLSMILAVAALLRFAALDKHALWFDEALTIVQSQWSVAEMIRYPTDPTPFLYYLIHKILFSMDHSAGAMRCLAVGAGVISVGLMYVLGRLCFGARSGLLAAALMAVSTSHVTFSQEARQYSLMLGLTLLTSIGVMVYANAVAAAEKGEPAQAGRRRLGLFLFAAGNVLSWYSHATSAIWIALTSLLVLWLAGEKLRRGRIRNEILVAYAAMALLALPGLWWVYVGHRYGFEHVEWLEQPSLVQFVSRIGQIYFPAGFWEHLWINSPSERLASKSIVLVVGFLCVIGGVLARRRSIRASFNGHRAACILIGLYFLIPFFLWAIGLISLPVLHARTLLYSLPGFILLLCLLVKDSRWAGWESAILVATFFGSTLLEIQGREKDDYRGAVRYLASHVRPGDVIQVCPPYDYAGLRHATRTVISAPVVTVATNGRILQLESALGADPNWAETFRRLVQIPEVEGRMGRPLDGPRLETPDQSAASLKVPAGAAVWRFNGRCEDYWSEDDVRTLADKALTGFRINPAFEWKQISRVDGERRLGISRYESIDGIPLQFRPVSGN
ncbi:MAG: glycosyltransferase family 39 protein [Beijerinckiaceae bacterium]|nr:glycosyltransferase family 39 protein [Beijerinckiaceae bacterium]